MSEKTAPTQPMNCIVCGHLSHGYHFGILACRACAAFFRRTVAEKKSYKCRGDGDCPVNKEQRNICRSCRFKKCEELGMNKDDVQMNRDPIGRKHDPAKKTVVCSPSGSSIAPGSTVITVVNPANEPKTVYTTNNPPISLVPYSNANIHNLTTLERLKTGFSNFNTSQKSLFKVLYPGQMFASEETIPLRQVSHSEYHKMERGCLSLIYSMLNDFFQPYSELEKDTKILLLQNFEIRFGLMVCIFHTYRLGSAIADDKWVVHYGQCIDEANIGVFMDDVACKDEAVLNLTATFARFRKIKKIFNRMQTDETEVAALSGILLWNEAALLMPTWEPCSQIREQILGELHNYLILKHGVGGTGARMGSLMCAVHELNLAAKEIREHQTMEKIFSPSADHYNDFSEFE